MARKRRRELSEEQRPQAQRDRAAERRRRSKQTYSRGYRGTTRTAETSSAR